MSESQDDAIADLNCLVGRDGPLGTTKMVQLYRWKSSSSKHKLGLGCTQPSTQVGDDRD
jgi:hypothetical protein